MLSWAIDDDGKNRMRVRSRDDGGRGTIMTPDQERGHLTGAGRDCGRVRILAIGQGMYFLATGIWPLLDLCSFERVTGPKVDRWLVKTVGTQVGAVGAALMLAARRRRVAPETALLAAGSAAGLAAIDVVYVARCRIRRVYLFDAAAELGFVVGWAVVGAKGLRNG